MLEKRQIEAKKPKTTQPKPSEATKLDLRWTDCSKLRPWVYASSQIRKLAKFKRVM